MPEFLDDMLVVEKIDGLNSALKPGVFINLN